MRRLSSSMSDDSPLKSSGDGNSVFGYSILQRAVAQREVKTAGLNIARTCFMMTPIYVCLIHTLFDQIESKLHSRRRVSPQIIFTRRVGVLSQHVIKT